ncbi:Lrp/AsnC family transcriptional regulator [Candidatus Woesearchaeota archaeon]|jgi:DNA-binding Lrp family transcriptional regulator|nr:Lrp/AsnC family transcriptional regulator [Candidatus Woesearchaeota archaeon]MBT4150543.1 Lrp/AsnC family transcriptional regulator [Candidatus Woesearchaeota archaeon]MBT4247184.1 Lrp/AsnC family transcriptional regulator [Candidatus Woesearchaeota archaeon]MBT4434591.1 Lrp/AsnC family transcriptional regulator [Candidatus Woesearchaeota archaeon]MBT7331964.1 Lrp/AsnC family transcriptional regulator [Candidatus Woesearchaeota archaeon]
MAYNLKPTDKKILNLLQKEDLCVPRITKIAHKLNLPTSTVQAKINKLQKLGLIKGFSAILDPEKLDKSFTAFMFGQAKLGEHFDLERVAKKLAKFPQVQEIFFISGDYDYLIKVRVKDQKEYYELIQKMGPIFEARAKGMVAPKCFKDTQKLEIN